MGKNLKKLWYLGQNHTVDMVLFNATEDKILLIERAGDPFAGFFALPGGFVDSHAPKGAYFAMDKENPKEAALRELQEETVVSAKALQMDSLQCVGFFDDPTRDPRNSESAKAVSWGFMVIAKGEPYPKAQSDAASVAWVSLENIRSGQVHLAFDHIKIIESALEFKQACALQRSSAQENKEVSVTRNPKM